MSITAGGKTFRVECDPVDVTSLHRPDTAWRFIDSQGHSHRWFADGVPADRYSPTAKHSVPTLKWVKDGVAYFEDGEPYYVGHNECIECGERIEPRYKADDYQQYVAGLRRYYINDALVSEEEFKRRALEAGIK